MNPKRFTVVDTRTNSTKTFESTANTVAELKADLRRNGINPDGMAIQEGLTKTELGEDGSYLPHDVPYKGGTTNNLVFRLTQKEKRIKSGAMSRSEAYVQIKNLGLAGHIASKYGKNYTQVKTDVLIAEIEAANETSKTEIPANGNRNSHTCKALTELTSLLVQKDILSNEEGEAIVGELGTELKAGTASEYTKNELDEMFADM